jgi:RNA polymerase sigma-70 factor (ECF subfamily)
VIFERHYRAVHRFAVGAVGESDGPDVAAEVFGQAFAVRHRYDPAYESAAPWLWGIASNLVGRYYRRRGRQKRAYRRVPFSLGAEPDTSEDTLNRVVAEAERPRIAQAMTRLRPEEAQVLLLYAVADLPYAEIAAVLEIPEGTVRSRLSRARTKLRNLLAVSGESN